MKYHFLTYSFFISYLCFAQSTLFIPLGGGANSTVRGLAYDSINSKLYVNGDFTLLNGNFPSKYIAVWNGVKWDSLRHILGDTVINFQRHKGDIYAYGGSYLKKLNPQTGIWQTISKTGLGGSITSVCNYGNDLVICGIFDSINGQPIKRIARFNGTNTFPFDNTPFSAISSMAEYQGKLYIGGGLFANSPCEAIYRLAVWDGVCWKSLANGIQGGFSSVGGLLVYKNKLYISGSFFKTEGNPGNCLFSYDGASFNDLGGGFIGTNGYIQSMFIYKGKLFLGGDSWSTIPGTNSVCPTFFSFDGEKFCTYFDHFPMNNSVWGMETFKDTLILNIPNVSVGGDQINRLAKYMGNLDNPLSCVSIVGMYENQNSPLQYIKLYPNPFSSVLNIKLPDDIDLSNANFTLNDCLGRELFSRKVHDLEEKLELDKLEGGIYFLKFSTPINLRVFKIVKE